MRPQQSRQRHRPAGTAPSGSFYDAVGGAATFSAIVSRFAALVADDDTLRPMYPADDMAGVEDRLRMFLEQYWGGPRAYSRLRGPPRLRMRHAMLRIGPAERDAWLCCMRSAIAGIDAAVLDDRHRSELLDYLDTTAHRLVNAADSLVNVDGKPQRTQVRR